MEESNYPEIACNESPTLDFQRFPHIGENIFEHLSDSELIMCRSVSKKLAEELLIMRWKDSVTDAVLKN